MKTLPLARPFLSSLLFVLAGCEVNHGPCNWEARFDRTAGQVQATSLVCDGIVTDPAVIHVSYQATSTPLSLAINANTFTPTLSFEPSLPDGTYAIDSPFEPLPYDPSTVLVSGAAVTGSFTFTRSRDVPFADIAQPKAQVYTSTIDATFDLVATFPHPDPAMGPGCRLETGDQHVLLSVTGPVTECSSSPIAGGH